MYLDYIKNDYSDKTDEEAEQYVERDKKHLARVLQAKVTHDIENIVERWYELDDIGFINEDGVFFELLKQAEELYSFGYFVGSISLIGVASEDLCKSIVTTHILGDNKITQFDRINLIYKKNKISKEVKDSLHQIRTIRNDYLHYNDKSFYANNKTMKENNFKVIILFKLVLKKLFIAEKIDYDKVIDKIVSNQRISFEDFKYRYRNMLSKTKTIDLQLNPSNSPKVVTDIFGVGEIDTEGPSYKEITLYNLQNYLPVIVDLTLPQVDQIKKLKLEERNGIVATLVSNISSIGQTEEWLLLDIHDVYRGEMKI